MSRARVLRPVSAQRARKLRKRGEHVYWHRELWSFVWEWRGYGR